MRGRVTCLKTLCVWPACVCQSEAVEDRSREAQLRCGASEIWSWGQTDDPPPVALRSFIFHHHPAARRGIIKAPVINVTGRDNDSWRSIKSFINFKWTPIRPAVKSKAIRPSCNYDFIFSFFTCWRRVDWSCATAGSSWRTTLLGFRAPFKQFGFLRY